MTLAELCEKSGGNSTKCTATVRATSCCNERTLTYSSSIFAQILTFTYVIPLEYVFSSPFQHNCTFFVLFPWCLSSASSPCSSPSHPFIHAWPLQSGYMCLDPSDIVGFCCTTLCNFQNDVCRHMEDYSQCKRIQITCSELGARQLCLCLLVLCVGLLSAA